MKTQSLTRRTFLKNIGLAGAVAPFFSRHLISAPPGRILRHASFGASGMAFADLNMLLACDWVKLVAVAEVDLKRIDKLKEKVPDVKVYQDWRELLDKEGNNIDSVNVSTPDHMHAPIAMSALQLGKHVYCQKPLTHDIYESRQLAIAARDKGLVTQMGIQIHSNVEYRLAVQFVQEGLIGKIKEVHSWSGKKWGDASPPPDKADPIPEGFDWDKWLGVCAARPFIGNGYYHPGQWRKRLDFGTGTFGDMGCHIYDPVYSALALTSPITVRSEGPAPSRWDWGTNARIQYVFPGTRFTAEDKVRVTWYDGDERPPKDIMALVADAKPANPPPDAKAKRKKTEFPPSQGSIFVGTKGAMLLPHIGKPVLCPAAEFKDFKHPKLPAISHWEQFALACIGEGKTTTGFDYSGPLTETVLLGSVAVRFPQTTLEWDPANLRFKNSEEAGHFIRRTYRKGWEVPGLSPLA